MKLLAAAVVVLVGAPAAADRTRLAKDADAWCAEHPGIAFTIAKDGSWSRTEDAADPERETFHVVWRGNLDGDRRADVILNQGSCGTRECVHGGYVQCRDRTFSSVFTQYAARVRVQPRRGGWAVLQLEHVGDATSSGSRDRAWDSTKFGPNGYDN